MSKQTVKEKKIEVLVCVKNGRVILDDFRGGSNHYKALAVFRGRKNKEVKRSYAVYPEKVVKATLTYLI